MSSALIGLGRLHIVADGMGGHKGGALAAQLTIDGLRRNLDQAPSNEPVVPLLQRAFARVNQEVYQRAHSDDSESQGMGSTAVVLLVVDRTAYVAHVGDSRAYLLRKRRLRRLTKDHTRAQRMVDAAVLTPEQALDHPSASVLERAVGTKPEVEVDIADILLRRADLILLCSDGLSGCVGDGDIQKILTSGLPVSKLPRRLVDLALSRGTKDNITVQCIQYGRPSRFLRVLGWALIVAVAAVVLLAYPVSSHMGYRTKLDETVRAIQSGYQKLSERLSGWLTRLELPL
jgi:serine/threonine protein phosphatase PrpC